MRLIKKAEQQLRAAIPALTTKQAAAALGQPVKRVLELIRAGELPAERKGRGYMIHPLDLRRMRLKKTVD